MKSFVVVLLIIGSMSMSVCTDDIHVGVDHGFGSTGILSKDGSYQNGKLLMLIFYVNY